MGGIELPEGVYVVREDGVDVLMGTLRELRKLADDLRRLLADDTSSKEDENNG